MHESEEKGNKKENNVETEDFDFEEVCTSHCDLGVIDGQNSQIVTSKLS